MANNNWINPLNSRLDADQTLVRAYDESTNRHRVDATVTATIGAVDVIINAANDNIAIRNTNNNNELLINANGSINVDVANITLNYLDDSVTAHQGTNPWIVAATNLDIRTLTFIRDNVNVSGSTVALDATTLAALESVSTNNGALETTQLASNTKLDTLIAKDYATSAKQDLQQAQLSAINLNTDLIEPKLDTLIAKDYATSVKQDTALTQLQAINSNTDLIEPKLDTLIAKDFSTATNQAVAQATLTAINNKFNSLGQKTSAASAPVVIASDQSAIPVAQSTTPWIVSGNSAVGAAPVNNPVNVSGIDAAGLKRHIKTDSLGRTEINAIQSIPQLPTSLSNGNLKVEPQLPNAYSRGVLGAARVVTAQNAFETLFSFDKQPNIWDEIIASLATSTFNGFTNSVDMMTNTTIGSSVVRQTFRRIRYNPSRTVQLIGSAVLGAGKVNVRKRIGQFDLEDGVFFEQDGLTNNVVRRSSTSGTVVDLKTPQSAWNIDKFDGTGPSGITVDFSKHQAFYIQYGFQGFADITYGFYLNSQIMFCHKEQTANNLTTPFMRTAHLPLRVEITNTGTTASPTIMSYNSFSVKNEGQDLETEGQVRSFSGAPIKTIGTATVPVLSIRLGAAFNKGIVDLISTSIFVNTADEVIWSLHLSPVLVGATFAVNSGYVQIDTAATAMTGGTELISSVLSQASSSTIISQDLLKMVNTLLGSSILGTTQIMTLAARSRLMTADVLSTIVWREYP